MTPPEYTDLNEAQARDEIDQKRINPHAALGVVIRKMPLYEKKADATYSDYQLNSRSG